MAHWKTATVVDQLCDLLALDYRFLELRNAFLVHHDSWRVLAAQMPDIPDVLD